MPINPKEERDKINRRVYGSKTFKRLKKIGKKKGLPNVDRYKKADRNILIEKIIKGKQLTDLSKSVILEQAQNAGLKVNASMSKETIINISTNPQLENYTKDKLKEFASKRGVPLPSQITSNRIRERLRNPAAYYTVNSLKELLKNNNVDTRGIKNKQGLINLAEERGLIAKPIKPEDIQEEANLWVSVKNIPEALKKFVKKKPRNAREAVAYFKEYIQNLNKDYLTPSRLKKLSQQLAKKINKAKEEEGRLFKPVEEKSALNKYAVDYVIKGDPSYGPVDFLNTAKFPMVNIMNNNRNIKVKLEFNVLMERMTPDPDGLKYPPKKFKFHSIGYKIITESTDTVEIYHDMISEILEEMQKVEQAEGSGHVFLEVENLTLHTDIWDPIKGSSYINLPPELKNKKALINMQNEDNKCLLWSVLRGLNPKDEHPERIDKDLKSKENTLNMEGIEYPVNLKDIKRFEKQNPEISVSVLGYSKDERIYPLRISKKENKRKHNIVLLLIKDGDKSHYCLAKNLSALLSSQVSKHKSKLYFCLNCLNGFDEMEKLEKHKEYCNEEESIKINMPKPDTYIKFINFLHSEKAPFAIYADFESLLKPLETCKPDPNKSYTLKYQKHEPLSFRYLLKSFDESVYKSTLREYIKENEEDPDPVDVFLSWLEADVKIISELGNKPMKITEEEQEQFNQASNCWICGNLLNLEDRVRDHCHYTGRYRGAAHNRCNLKYKKTNNISVFFHNLAGYDSHLFIKKLNNTMGPIDCIPNNE